MTQQSPQKPTLEERITDAVFKIITAGGSIYAFYHLFLEDFLKAAIANKRHNADMTKSPHGHASVVNSIVLEE